MKDDLISRQAVDKIIDDLLENDNLQASPSVWHGFHMIKQLPSVQPDWGKPVGDGRPLADGEVIARLQDIKKQIGGSYAIERAIEMLKWLPSAQPTPCDVCRHNPPSSMGGKPCCMCPAEGREE